MNLKRQRWLGCLSWLAIVWFATVLFVVPLLTTWLVSAQVIPVTWGKVLTYLEQIQKWSMIIFLVTWVFFVGSCFASFLNVVAWRVPRGRGILGSSHCPACGIRLAFRDNLPVIGWLGNQGQCRSCHAPISIRYLLVEVVLGLLFLLFALVILVWGGVNLPYRTAGSSFGFERMMMEPDGGLICVLAHQLILISALFTFSLIVAEKFTIPKIVFSLFLLFSVGLPLCWPDCIVASWELPFVSPPILNMQGNAWLTIVLGGFSGCLIGVFFDRVDFPDFGQSGITLGMVLTGVTMGWQAVGWVSMLYLLVSIAAVVYAVFTKIKSEVILAVVLNRYSCLLLAVTVELLCWRMQVEEMEWILGVHRGWVIVAGLPVLTVFAVLLHRMRNLRLGCTIQEEEIDCTNAEQ